CARIYYYGSWYFDVW
nr:immunoglobulin heavy chain junction region [Mus musculus]NSM04278.1 immunoglobulin heavy chain junction region [Mus musculus]NSM04563.1 immunoglobulin heavy chain junction region [Mus musculus]NSM04582.1 immunoglobulin heavy chain junction region [Mus musculus]NSM05544.1 immunoglobulin heavy chain junction region [Mus musculus]